MPRSRPKIGSVFGIPLLDGGMAIGQVLAHEKLMMNSITCLVTSLREWVTGDQITKDVVVACQFTTHDLLSYGKWEILGRAAINLSQKDFPYERLRKKRWVGASMVGSGNIESLMNAWHGLAVWDDWHDPEYLDKLLFHSRTRPPKALLKEDVGDAG